MLSIQELASGKEDCTVITMHGDLKGWVDFRCDHPQGGVCVCSAPAHLPPMLPSPPHRPPWLPGHAFPPFLPPPQPRPPERDWSPIRPGPAGFEGHSETYSSVVWPRWMFISGVIAFVLVFLFAPAVVKGLRKISERRTRRREMGRAAVARQQHVQMGSTTMLQGRVVGHLVVPGEPVPTSSVPVGLPVTMAAVVQPA